MFAYDFNTTRGQVIVMSQDDDEGDPEIRFYYKPPNLGVCSVAFGYDDYSVRDEVFAEVNLALAEAAAKQIDELTI